MRFQKQTNVNHKEENQATSTIRRHFLSCFYEMWKIITEAVQIFGTGSKIISENSCHESSSAYILK
jgi:hypothetical protein